MKKSFFLAIILINLGALSSCFGNTNGATSTSSENVNTTNYSLSDCLRGMVLSSNFPLPEAISREKIEVEIDSEDDGVYLCRVYFETDGTGTLGWVKYDAKSQKLYTITDDENPVQLNFTNSWAEKFNVSLEDKTTTYKEPQANTKTVSSGGAVADFDNLYKKANEISLPFEPTNDFIIDQDGFIAVPEDLYPIFCLKPLGNLKMAKLPALNAAKPILVFTYNEAGQSLLYLLSISNSNEIIGELELYSCDENNDGFQIKSIDANWLIKIEVIQSGKSVIENYQIQLNGEIVRINL